MEKYLSTDLSNAASYVKQQGRQWYIIWDGERLYWNDLYGAYTWAHNAIRGGEAHRMEPIAADPATYGDF